MKQKKPDPQGAGLIDYGWLAQQAAEQHLDALNEAEERATDGEDVDWPDSAAPYCGCQTCVIREVLHAAWPYLQQQAATELLPRKWTDGATWADGTPVVWSRP